MNFLWIALFGLLGIFSRYGLDQTISRFPSLFPWGTFLINLTGSFIAGLVYVIGVEKALIPPPLRVALLVGFAGGFTTFSAYCLQTVLQWDQNRGVALAYLCLSPALGVGAVMAGIRCGKLFISTT